MMRIANTNTKILLVAAALAGLSGCSSDYRIDFTYNSSPPDGAIISFDSIRIHEGIAVGVEAQPMDDDELMDRETFVRLVSDDPSVLGVQSTLSKADVDASDDLANWSFVIFGVKTGSTRVTVYIDDELEGEIPAVVEPQ